MYLLEMEWWNMKKINIKFLFIALIIGIVLGFITEYSLILNFKYLKYGVKIHPVLNSQSIN